MTATAPPPDSTLAAAHTDAQIRDALLTSLALRILTQASGTDLPGHTRLSGSPQRAIWLGQLASEPQLAADQARGLKADRLVPAAEGFAFRLASAEATTVHVTLSFAVYIALHPTVAEQVTFIHSTSGEADPSVGAGAAGSASNTGRKIAAVWAKVPVGPIPLTVTLPARTGSFRLAAAEITAAIRDAVHAPAGSEPYRARRRVAPAGSLPRDADMVDDATWASYTASNLIPAADAAFPVFCAALDVELGANGTGHDVLFTVINTTPAAETQFADRAGLIAFDRPHLDTRLYQVQLTATTSAPVAHYTLEQIADSYRYDRTVPALGQAAPGEYQADGAGTTLATRFGALAKTWRVHPRSETLTGEAIDTSFDALTANPADAVERIVDAHAAWVDANWSHAALDEIAAARGWDADARANADRDAAAARDEVAWLRAGAQTLAADPLLAEAFRLANRSMKQVGAHKNYTAWRLFQIAWIVGCLPGISDPAADNTVQIETVQTGGGKSEAYLGVMLMHLFYARLTGTTAGVNVWARFPLRLLAAQQTERFTEAVLAAELLRREHPRISGGDPFGVGFIVGSTNTPNKIYPADNQHAHGVDPHGPALAERCRVLEHCPVCDPHGTGTRIAVRFDEPTWSMQHVCTNANCPMRGTLPVWVIDDDIYRHAPSVLVGTVDRLAQIAHAPQFKILFGSVHSRCPRHGYTSEPRYCSVFGCTASRAPIPDGFGHLRCEIADELHLLEESLGALDAMYETLLQQIAAALGNPPLHIVAATATLEGYQNQVDHLYQRPARRFPAPGPDAGETFFSRTDPSDPLRRYLGLRPRGVTMVTAAAEATRMHAEWLAEALADPAAAAAAAGLDPGDPHVFTVVRTAVQDDYKVVLGYCLRNEDLSSFTADERVKSLLDSADNLAIISGSVEPAAIREAVGRLTNPPTDPARQVRIVAGTRAIGHGFDSPRLGFMVLMGTPTQAAEVIQATARVGRVHPGLIIHIFNPSRDRDSSVFRYYTHWIAYLDRLVHKVPVNRESLPVLRRVLSGALMAWLLQVHDAAWMTSGQRRYSLAKSTQVSDALTAGFIDRTTLIAELTASLGLSPTNSYHDMHREAVARYIDDTLSRLAVSADPNKRTSELLDPNVPTSLRDIEKPVIIYGNV